MRLPVITDVGSRIARTCHLGKARAGELVVSLGSNEDLRRDLQVGGLIVAMAAGAWSLGVLNGSSIAAAPVVFSESLVGRFTCQTSTSVVSQSIGAGEAPRGTIVASKNGTKYHYLSCPGAGSIKEENKVWFDSEEAARAAGYTKAANCK